MYSHYLIRIPLEELSNYSKAIVWFPSHELFCYVNINNSSFISLHVNTCHQTVRRLCYTLSLFIDSPSCPFSCILFLVYVSPLAIGQKSCRERSMARKPGCGWPFASVYGGEYCCREYCSSWRSGDRVGRGREGRTMKFLEMWTAKQLHLSPSPHLIRYVLWWASLWYWGTSVTTSV